MRPLGLQYLRKTIGNAGGLDCIHHRGGIHNEWCDDCDDSDYYSNSEFSFISDSSTDYDYANENERENIDLQYMLKITDQLSITPDILIQPAFTKIIQSVFNNNLEAVIKAIAAQANKQQLQQIYDIIYHVNNNHTINDVPHPPQSEDDDAEESNNDEVNESGRDAETDHDVDAESNHDDDDEDDVNVNVDDIDDADEVDECDRDDYNVEIEHSVVAAIKPNNDRMNDNYNYFDTLSKGSISNICGYLTRRDIKAFKLCSNRIGIICLEEMTKHSVGILNMNELINLNCTQFELANNIKYSRHNPNKTLSYLQEVWSKQHSIPESQQLMFPYNKKKRDETIIKILGSTFEKFRVSHTNDTKISDFSMIDHQRRYLVFDKRNIIKINELGQCSKMTAMDEFDSAEHHLIILNYFDINTNTTKTIQYLMIENNTTYTDILNYIEYDFVATNTAQTDFYNKLQKEMETNRNSDNMLCVQYRISDRLDTPYHRGSKAKFEWRRVDKKFMDKPISTLFHYNKCIVIRFMLNPEKEWKVGGNCVC